MFLSIIVPCYNEESTIFEFHKELKDVFDNNFNKNFTYELILIDDGSDDNTLNNIKKLIKIDKNIKYISFSRNFGKEAAIYAGLKNSNGDYIVLMDADLQDPPKLIPKMISIIKSSDYDCISSRRVSRKGEPLVRSFFAKKFYKLMNKFSDVNLVDGERDYRLMTRQMVNSILELKEYNRFSKGIFNWVGFKIKYLEYENIERINGETSWSFWSLLKYAIEGVVSFSSAPLSISTFFGIIFSIFAFILIIFIIIRNLLYGDSVQGWTSTICIILLIGGIQLFTIGILGKYIENIYLESKHRPLYITKEDNIKK